MENIQLYILQCVYRGSYIYIYVRIYIYIYRISINTHTYMVAAVAQWLRRCATNREFAGTMPGDVTGISQ